MGGREALRERGCAKEGVWWVALGRREALRERLVYAVMAERCPGPRNILLVG